MIAYIFYGSLMDLELLYRIVGRYPESVNTGSISGRLLQIHDETEPNGITSYPMLIAEPPRVTIPAILCWFDGETAGVECTLQRYEGEQFDRVSWEFTQDDGQCVYGYVFLGQNEKGA